MKVEVAVLGSQFLAVFMVSVDVAATLKKETRETIVRSRHTVSAFDTKNAIDSYIRKPLTLKTPLTVTPESL